MMDQITMNGRALGMIFQKTSPLVSIRGLPFQKTRRNGTGGLLSIFLLDTRGKEVYLLSGVK